MSKKSTTFKISLYLLSFSLLFIACKPVLLMPAFALEQAVVTSQTKYVDKYFELDQNGDFKLHIYLPDGQKIGTLDSTGNIIYPLSDHLGSPTIITNQSGQVVETNDYESYGKLKNTNTQINNSYKYTGKELDNETNLQYYGARYYDNQLGRFISMDPAILILHDGQKLKEVTRGESKQLLSNPQNLNSYAYAINNPVKMKDDDGNFPALAAIAIAWVAAEVGFSGWDAYDAGNAWFGENISNSDKVWSGGALVAGLALPGSGKVYTTPAKIATNMADNIGKELTLGTRAISNFLTNSFSEAKIQAKFDKHVGQLKEFGDISIKEFKSIIDDVWHGNGNILEKVRSNGDVLRFDMDKGIFSSISKSGDLKTFFRPTKEVRPLDYWFKQQ